MAARSLLGIREPHPLVIGSNSSCPRWVGSNGECASRLVQDQCWIQRDFAKLHQSCASVQAFRSGSLHFSSDGGDRFCHQEGHRWPGQAGIQRRGKRLVEVFCVVTEKIAGGSQLNASTDQSVRRLILLRHAKSSWTDRTIKVIHDIITAAPTSRSRISRIWSNMEKSWFSDHERPLSKRGRQAAANIALKLYQQSGWEPQLILCSDSTRTKETLDIMQQQLEEYLEGEVRYFSSFYSVAAMDGQTVQHLQEIICKHSKDDVTTIMCMGHNRGWEEAASLLSGVSVELKTANAALLETRGSSWQEAFEKAGLGGWKLMGIVKPDTCKTAVQ